MPELGSDKRPYVDTSGDNPTKKQNIGDTSSLKEEKAKMAAMIIALILQTKQSTKIQ